MPNTTPINLGPYILNAPTPDEQGHIRNRLSLGSAALLNASFANNGNLLTITDPTNDSYSITFDETKLNASIADRLKNSKNFSITGDAVTRIPVSFDGTANVSLVVTIPDNTITSDQLKDSAVTALKIGAGVITRDKLSVEFQNELPQSTGEQFSSKLPTLAVGYGRDQPGLAKIELYSSTNFPVEAFPSASIYTNAEGKLAIENGGNGPITIGYAGSPALSIASGNVKTVTSLHQKIGFVEIISNKINGARLAGAGAGDSEAIALNYESSDDTYSTPLDTVVYDGKRSKVARFFGDSKTFETYGSCRSLSSSQTGAASAGLQSNAATGFDAMVALTAGANSIILKYSAPANGLQIRNAADTAYSDITANKITLKTALTVETVENVTPTIYLQGSNSKAGLAVSADSFYVYNAGGELTPAVTALAINLSNKNATFSGNVSSTGFTSSSSIRYKERVSPIHDGLGLIKQLTGVRYFWKQDGSADIGLIAEDVQTVLPELVHIKDKIVEGIDYGKLTAVLIEAVKELSNRVEQLEKQLAP